MDSNKTSVILAGANREIFNNNSLLIWNQNEPLRIVITIGVIIRTKDLMNINN